MDEESDNSAEATLIQAFADFVRSAASGDRAASGGPEPLLTIADAARYLSVSTTTVRNLAVGGKVRSTRATRGADRSGSAASSSESTTSAIDSGTEAVSRYAVVRDLPPGGLRGMSATQLNDAVGAFSTRYVNDWDWWLTVPAARRPQVLGQILRRWKATRPLTMRRTRPDGLHPPPYLEDLYAAALDPLRALDDLTVATVADRSPEQADALRSLWSGFSGLTTTRTASCVGISKAILLVTDGRIGPAFDSQVRTRLGLKPPTTSDEWLATLGRVANDIAAFEARSGPLVDAVPERFRHLSVGRLYDMALGPREPGS